MEKKQSPPSRRLVCGVGASFIFFGVSVAEPVRVEVSESVAGIENAQMRVTYDLVTGTYGAWDKASGRFGLRGARARVNGWTSDDQAYRRSASVHESGDGGKTLAVRCDASSSPALLLEITLYPDKPFVVLAAGIENGTSRVLTLREVCPLENASVFPSDGLRAELRTLDGFDGSGPTQVRTGAARSSPNNLLLTYLAEGQRRSLVLGGLTYHEFCKRATLASVSPEQVRCLDLGQRLGGRARLGAYLDCGKAMVSEAAAGPSLRVAQGQSSAWNDAGSEPYLTSFARDRQRVVVEAEGLDAAKAYVLGWSWWDFDSQGRVESLVAVGGDGKSYTLVDKQTLPPRNDTNPTGRPPQERAVVIPAEAYSSGKVQIQVSREKGGDAVVSELWLWEGRELSVPADWAAGRPVLPVMPPEQSDAGITAELQAADPVGKRVDAGASYLGDEKFYVDFVTADPFAALEQYGLAVRAAQQARPNMYDFPTVCGWYVGLYERPEAQNYPEKSKYLAATTAGLVEETQLAADSGFLKYSRMAVRVVPDKYETKEPKGVTQGGWWDDEHWAKYGHYTPPYETTRKYCEGVRARGGLPFTYFQCVMEDRAFCQAHSNLVLKTNAVGLDYSNPLTQEHMRTVYANLRAGGMAGMMFDYADSLWSRAVKGGLADPYATAGSFYRTFFSLAKEGLGPDSWIHERVLCDPYSDLTAGVVDSQRTWGDNNLVSPQIVSRSGLRWYKNRVLFSYDMDAKNLLNGWKGPGFHGSDQDGRRMLLTMAYVAASRLLLSTSYREMPRETLQDLSRTFPYHRAPQSARPVDMLVCRGHPRVYDFAVGPKWHQVTFFNTEETSGPTEVSVMLSGDVARGSLGLDASAAYHAYDFWNDRYLGRFNGAGRLAQTLRPGEARMFSVHQVEAHPQFISTRRHIMQGYLDLAEPPAWDAAACELRGVSRVIGGEPYQLVLAGNGFRPVSAAAGDAGASVKPIDGAEGLARVTLASPVNADIRWSVRFVK